MRAYMRYAHDCRYKREKSMITWQTVFAMIIYLAAMLIVIHAQHKSYKLFIKELNEWNKKVAAVGVLLEEVDAQLKKVEERLWRGYD